MRYLILILFLIGCSAQKTEIFQVDSLFKIKKIPKSLFWGDIDLNQDGIRENYLTTIKRQTCLDCYIYSVLGAFEIQYQIDHGLNSSLNLSEQNIHNCLKIHCERPGPVDIIANYIRDVGVMDEYHSPFGTWRQCENCSGRIKTKMGEVEISQIPFYRIKSWIYITLSYMSPKQRKEELVKALQNGPVVTNSMWDYKRYKDVLFCQKGEGMYHSIVLVGYLNNGEIFLVKNSHGEGRILKVVFDGSERCDFARESLQITRGTTYVDWGVGEKFCYSMQDMDKDKIPDAYDNCPIDVNTAQVNEDQDIFGDVCDPCPKDKLNKCGDKQ